jgi:hypothetical protein
MIRAAVRALSGCKVLPVVVGVLVVLVGAMVEGVAGRLLMAAGVAGVAAGVVMINVFVSRHHRRLSKLEARPASGKALVAAGEAGQGGDPVAAARQQLARRAVRHSADAPVERPAYLSVTVTVVVP